jgi:hypothetical protein
VAAVGHENVCRLDVTMHDALGVSRIQGIRHFDPYAQNTIEFQWPVLYEVLQRFSAEVLHDDEQPVFMLSDFMDRADVGVIERRRSPRLPTKPLQRLRLLAHIFRQELERDETSEGCVFGLVNHAHSAATDGFQDAVMGDRLANQRLLRNRHWQLILGGFA